MEIVDAQVHLNRLGATWATSEPSEVVERAIVAMDAVGVNAVLIGEHASDERSWHTLPNGARRRTYPFSELAVAMYPDRFAYYVVIDRRDPEIDAQMAAVRSKPNALCIRVVPLPATGEIDHFARGAYEPIWSAAEQYDVPLFVGVPGNLDKLVPYLEKFPRAQVIMDHAATLYAGETPRVHDVAARFAEFERVIALARFPNLFLKWCHAPDRISAQAFPFEDLAPYARRLIDAFGAQRMMWASDYTVVRHHHSWAQALHHMLHWRILSESEAEWIFGKTIRSVLRWPP